MMLDDHDFQLIKKLTETPGISGNENYIRNIIKNEVKDYCDEIIVDKLGNLICKKKGTSDNLRIMIAAHMDNIGFMIKYIDDKGFLRVEPVGGIDPQITGGQSVLIFHGDQIVNGVIAIKPIHLLEQEERIKPKNLHDIFIDIGAKSKEDAEKIVSIGDFIIFNYTCKKLGNSLISSGGFDDRAGCFVLIKTIKNLKELQTNADLFFTFTAQEEIGVRGATTSSFAINPDIGFVLEVTHAIDYPNVSKEKSGDIKLGNGPVIFMGPNIHPKLFKLIINMAESNKIPFQISVRGQPQPNDARVIQITREGVATAGISVPLRYMHSPIEVIDLNDLDLTIKLLTKILTKMKPDVDLKL